MKLITTLLLCSGLLLTLTQGEEAQEIDCNDEAVFQAVDFSLKQFNPGVKSGNQYMLHRVIEGTKTDGSPTFYSFKYLIKEGNCSAQSGLAWQDCDFKDAEEAATGECTATVGKRENEFFIVTQTCKIAPSKAPILKAYFPCIGCVHAISTDSPDLEPVLKHSIEHFNNNTDHSHLFTLRKVKSAHRQVVAGLNFDITYTIVQTNCSKERFPSLHGDCVALPNGVVAGTKYVIEFIARETKCSKESNTELAEDCEIKHLGQSLDCNANVYMRPWENKVVPTVKCQALDMTEMARRPPGFSPFRSVTVQETKEGRTRLLRACEYKGRLSKAGAEPAPERQAESSQVKQ
ncbi:kininogen-1 isoform 4 precursor [Mus musculus]|uniref:kininogen-1 isoform 4 precursor n=1 Tax=Mus musculus TaxID=10090 RepID=UPI0011AE7259|nr:kininogen-1 isoform 4 precursor [Mus musculus]XP_030104848.1 kininogen-1 isoform X2 [Mus musculus]